MPSAKIAMPHTELVFNSRDRATAPLPPFGGSGWADHRFPHGVCFERASELLLWTGYGPGSSLFSPWGESSRGPSQRSRASLDDLSWRSICHVFWPPHESRRPRRTRNLTPPPRSRRQVALSLHGSYKWRLDGTTVLHDLALDVQRGELVAVLGEVGVGVCLGHRPESAKFGPTHWPESVRGA